MKYFVGTHKLCNHKPLFDSQKEINEMVLSIWSISAAILDVFHRIANGSYTFRRFLHTHTHTYTKFTKRDGK